MEDFNLFLKELEHKADIYRLEKEWYYIMGTLCILIGVSLVLAIVFIKSLIGVI